MRRLLSSGLYRFKSPQDLQKLFQALKSQILPRYEQFRNHFNQHPPHLNYLLLFTFSLPMSYYIYQCQKPPIKTFQSLISELQKDNILSIDFQSQSNGNNAYVRLSNGTPFSVHLGSIDHCLSVIEAHQLEKGRNPEHFIPIQYVTGKDSEYYWYWTKQISHIILQIIFMGVILKSLSGKAPKAQKGFHMENKVNVKFKDVAGQDEVKREVMEFVDFLKNPAKYETLGARLPKGMLLTGPPGTGKTLLAKACAGEAGVPFFSLSGSDFVEMFVGVGASRVRDLFKKAKKSAPCIIFIDEIDAIGKKRDGMSSNEEKDNTLNQILVEMDGFGTSVNVIVMAATNRKDLLDSALIRPGRFDRQIDVGVPDLEGRQEIFKIHLKPIAMDPKSDINEQARRLAVLSPGFSGADIANLCNEAAILASRKNKNFVEAIDFELASERILAGAEKKMHLSLEEKRTIAIHESGHAVVSWFTEGCDPLVKLTIIPRSKGSLGYAQYLPNEGFIQQKQQLLDTLCFILGGRSAEVVFFDKVTTGASDDLQKVYNLANNVVTKFGMSDMGHIAFQKDQFELRHSEDTQKNIDQAIQTIVKQASQRSMQIVQQYKKEVEKLADKLMEKETLDLKQIIEVLGERPFQSANSFDNFRKVKENP